MWYGLCDIGQEARAISLRKSIHAGESTSVAVKTIATTMPTSGTGPALSSGSRKPEVECSIDPTNLIKKSEKGEEKEVKETTEKEKVLADKVVDAEKDVRRVNLTGDACLETAMSTGSLSSENSFIVDIVTH